MENVLNFFCSSEFISSVIFVVLMFVFWTLFKKLLHKYFDRRVMQDKMGGKKETYIRLLINIIKYILLVITIIVVLQIYGINVSSLVAGLGIAGAVAGLALQDALKDFIMGTNIISNNFFIIGDVVKYKNVEGKVIGLGLKTTKIQDIYTNNILTICNRNISEITKVSDWLDIDVPVEYDADQSFIRKSLQEISVKIQSLDDVNECKLLGTEKFGDYALVYRLRLFCSPELKPIVRRPAMDLIIDELEKKKIVIPMQQYEIFMENKK